MYTREEKERFLALLKDNKLNTCRAVDLFRKARPEFSRRTFYNWLAKDQWFAQALDDLKEGELDEAEDMLKLYISGIPIKNDKGEITGWVQEPSYRALMDYLKAKGGKRGYQQNTRVIIEGAPQPEEIDETKFNDLTEDELAAYVEISSKINKQPLSLQHGNSLSDA